VKLSNKGRYAVRALFDIAFYNEGRPTQVKDIAERQGIPPRFLEQIFQDLKRAGLVGSKRGPQGGYSLLKEPMQISVGDVLRVTDGPVSLADTSEELDKHPGPSCRQATESVFEDLSKRVEACLDSVSVADICSRAETLGIRKHGTQRYVYVI
jgi:Rrf2 family protein